MFEEEDIAFNGLEGCSYRHLQQMAKGMGLPSNVKKVYLIEMINAKKYSTDDELNEIVNRIKMERKANAHTKKNKIKNKKRLQGTEVSTTSLSPRLSVTPKRPTNYFIQYSPNETNETVVQYQPPNIIRSATSILQPMKSDRVLRSFNMAKRPNYRIMDSDSCLYDVVKAQNTVQEIRRERYQSVTVQKHRPVIEASVVVDTETQLVPVLRSSNISPRPTKCQRRVSGIYPLQPTNKPFYEYGPTVGFRRQDGRVSKINAIIQKQPQAFVPKKIAPKPIVVTIQDVINYKVDSQTDKNSRDIVRSRYQSDSQAVGHKAINYTAHPQIENITDTRDDTECFGNDRLKSQINIHNSFQPINIEPALSRSVYTEGPRKSTRQRIDPNIYSFSNIIPDKTEHQSDYNFERQQTDKTYSRNREHNQRETLGHKINNYRPVEPKSIDYQHEYQRFNQELTERSQFENYEFNRNSELQYPNMPVLTDVCPNEDYYTNDSMKDSNCSIYYHKKIRAEQVRTQKNCEQLPRINEVFSQFKDVEYRNLNQPLYVQVSEESERVPLPAVTNANSTSLLENLYNFKSQFVTNPPILQIVTTHTNPTYSAHTVTTAVANSTAGTHYCSSTPYERADACHVEEYPTRFDEYLDYSMEQRTDIGCDEVLSSSTVSLETTNSQELGANVTIPEMVEDALELISQDGDYMERIGMDVRVQCILCDWAGPKLILEQHIIKEHPNEIQHSDSGEWSVLFTLGELMSRQAWASQLAQSRGDIFVVSAKCRDADTITVALSTISSDIDMPKRGRITVYNKISGKPYSHEGEIKPLPDSMPYECDVDSLVLDIDNLDLIPNSANLRLVNRELVVRSPAKVIIGQPQFNNVEIVIYIKLVD